MCTICLSPLLLAFWWLCWANVLPAWKYEPQNKLCQIVRGKWMVPDCGAKEVFKHQDSDVDSDIRMWSCQNVMAHRELRRKVHSTCVFIKPQVLSWGNPKCYCILHVSVPKICYCFIKPLQPGSWGKGHFLNPCSRAVRPFFLCGAGFTGGLVFA